MLQIDDDCRLMLQIDDADNCFLKASFQKPTKTKRNGRVYARFFTSRGNKILFFFCLFFNDFTRTNESQPPKTTKDQYPTTRLCHNQSIVEWQETQLISFVVVVVVVVVEDVKEGGKSCRTTQIKYIKYMKER